MHRGVVRGVAGAVFGLWTAAASAHDTWLLPARFEVAPGGRIELEMTSGMRFPDPETPVRPERLAATGIRVGGRTAPLQTGTPGKAALKLSAPASVPGVATLWVVTRSRTLTLKPDEVKHYLEGVGAPASVEERWRKQQRWRESYAKLAKTYVAVGSASADRSWEEPAGLRLEIVPLQDPTALREGSQLAVRVLREGRPVADLSVSALPPGHAKPITTRTDGDGRALFLLDRAGPWLLRGTLIEESSAADLEWETLFATLSISVGRKE